MPTRHALSTGSPWLIPLLVTLSAAVSSSGRGEEGAAAALPTPAAERAELSGLPAPAGPFQPLEQMPPEARDRLLDLLAYLIRENIPEEFEDDRRWGKTTEAYAGVRVRIENGRLKTNRRWRELNHGLWQRYEVELVDPERHLEVQASNLAWGDDGRLELDLVVDARVRAVARRARWNLGVQLFSVHVDADARVRFSAQVSVGFDLDYSRLPPDVVVDPRVESAEVALRDFKVQRISRIGGDLAEEMGGALEGLLRRQVLDAQNAKLAARMNRQIDRRRDSLRISASDWIQRWLGTRE